MFRRDFKNEFISEEELDEIIKNASEENERKRHLFDIYLGKEIPSKGRVAEGRPNNHAYTNFAKYISDTATGYFMGIAPKYSFDNKTEAEIFRKVFDKNDEASLNYEIAQSMSICGVGYDVVYIDENSNLKISVLDPREITAVYDDRIGGGLKAVIRSFYKTVGKQNVMMGEVYTDKYKLVFEYRNGKPRYVKKEKNYIGRLPVCEYKNNSFMTGDFEACLENIELYNLLLSNASDDLQSIANAYLAISGMLGTTAEDIKSMNETRIALLSDGGHMEFITKNLDASAVENHKKSLRQDILQVAGIPDLSDEKLLTGLSGTAMEYRLWALDQLRAKKQAGMDKGLFERLKIIESFLNLRFANIENIENRVSILYSRNIPQDTSGIIGNAEKLHGKVSRKTYLGMVESFTGVTSEDEEKRIEDELRTGERKQMIES